MHVRSRNASKGERTYWAYRCRHSPYRHCTFDVGNDGACDDDGVSFRLADARPHTPCALCDLEADERGLSVSGSRIDVPRPFPMIIGNKTFYRATSTKREIHSRSFLHRSRTLEVSPLCTYIFDRRPTDLCRHVASSDLTRRFLTLARRLQGHFDSIIFISLFLSC